MKRNERAGKILIAPAKLARHFLGCCDSCAMFFLTRCPEHDLGFKPKFHCGADGKPTPPEVSSQSTRATVAVSRNKALAGPAPSATAKAPLSTLLLRCLRFDLLNRDGL
jgi:hypothetical protein